ncbi:HPr family phosphocarrier protein [Streptacidiphilus jiangxiensis]|uniref:Phosphocarrier protein HPr n=1 Tax=Streptacidiphilus jiangxiensis TaxID=235985 RepID=A0A1H7UR01_STRJI|nr:HPr family phosphocarrier protein [Streptacidiphilus jiangxiensis]SEL99442.1 phosphocarrier protein [Streptacidiphilus jiangxiensis]
MILPDATAAVTARTTVGTASGLHARPASVFVQAVVRHPHAVRIARPGEEPVDGRSLLAVMSLAATYGEELELTVEEDPADAERARAVLDELAALMRQDLEAAAAG